MRIFSIITAIIVTAALYGLVFERERLLAFASGETTTQTVETTEPEPVEVVEDEQQKERVISVVALKSKAQQIDSGVLLRGQTEAARQVDVRSETTGLIRSDPLRKGTYVEAGQLLCEIEVGTRDVALLEARARVPEANARLPEAEGRLAEAQAQIEEAQINDNAAKQLSEDGFASNVRVATTRAMVQSALAGLETAKAGVESARAAALTAEAAVRAAEKEIDKLTIMAPFSGLLETDTAELGALMQPGSLCATIIQLNPIKLVGFVPETEVAKVKTGAMASARTTAGQEVSGTVSFLSRSSDPETRTFRVEVTVANEDLMLSDGQTAEILIAADGQLAHLLPASAMTLDDSGTLGVRTATNGRAGFTPITILRDTAKGVWVSGLEAEIDVIITGQEFVTNGVKVSVSYAEDNA